jgi:uncharacterized protein (TIGR03435 family)
MRRSLCVTLTVLCAGVMCGQQPAPKVADSAGQAAYVPSLTFDVASVRESKPETTFMVGGPNPAHSSLVRLSNYDVANLLIAAYGLDPAQLVGLPEWTRGSYFNVEAKSDESVDERLAKLTDEQARLEKQHMFQVLLVERFQLKVHWETREGPIYELVVAKNGPKLHPGGSLPPTSEEIHNFGDRKIPALYQRGNGIKGYEYIGHSCSLQSIAGALAAQMGEPVIDKTGLTGTYDFILQYRGRGPDASDDPTVWPPLLTAVPDQLGLKLQPAKGENQFLVIDHIERPSEN